MLWTVYGYPAPVFIPRPLPSGVSVGTDTYPTSHPISSEPAESEKPELKEPSSGVVSVGTDTYVPRYHISSEPAERDKPEVTEPSSRTSEGSEYYTSHPVTQKRFGHIRRPFQFIDLTHLIS
jgi:hypothetical protein